MRDYSRLMTELKNAAKKSGNADDTIPALNIAFAYQQLLYGFHETARDIQQLRNSLVKDYRADLVDKTLKLLTEVEAKTNEQRIEEQKLSIEALKLQKAQKDAIAKRMEVARLAKLKSESETARQRREVQATFEAEVRDKQDQ